MTGGQNGSGALGATDLNTIKQYGLLGDADGKNILPTDPDINHYFGMHMSTRFVQQYGGHTDASQSEDVTFYFSGDDDMWLFIDGKLVADLGGNHDPVSVNVNFDTGEVRIESNEEPRQTVTTWLQAEMGLSGNTLPDDTYHTLDFFYLERGNYASNLKLRYNLVYIPESKLVKIDEKNKPVAGAEFALYRADANGKPTGQPLANGTTDANGEFVLERDGIGGQKYIVTPAMLYNIVQNPTGPDIATDEKTDMVLVETKTPAGHRPMGNVELFFHKGQSDKEILLLANNVWRRGAWSMPKITAVLPSRRLTVVDNGTPTLKDISADPDPVMFGVVFQRQSDGRWLPIAGDPLDRGWQVYDTGDEWGNILAAEEENTYLAQVSTSGAYVLEMDKLPGEIRSYYYFDRTPNAQYAIVYYYTTADSVANATRTDTWRIYDDNYTQVERELAIDLYVSNVTNQLLVQKLDGVTGEGVGGAEFTLYKLGANGARTAVGTVTTDLDFKSANGVAVPGGAVFTNLDAGEYELVETAVPEGYALNNTPIPVVVDETGVYAGAGTKYDGVTVRKSVGSIMGSMEQFAEGDVVDITLNNIKAALAVGGTQDDVKNAAWPSGSTELHLEYTDRNNTQDYGPYGVNEPTVEHLTLATDTGWSSASATATTPYTRRSRRATWIWAIRTFPACSQASRSCRSATCRSAR